MSESLGARQRQFLDHVRGASDAVPDLADGPVPAALGLAVYVNAYRARLREALAADHPRLARHLGEERWLALCDAYIDAQPSSARSLRTFGDRLPGFIERQTSAGAAYATAMAGAAGDTPVGAASAAIGLPHPREPEGSRLKSLPQTFLVGSEVAAVGEASTAIERPHFHERERSRLAFNSRRAGQSLPQTFLVGSEVAPVGAASAAMALGEAKELPVRSASTARNASREAEAQGNFDDSALLAELARFERCLLDAFDAADAPRLAWSAFETLPAQDWPGLRLVLHPSLHHLPMRTRAVALWQSLADPADARDVMGLVPACVFVWRDAARITRLRAFAADEEAALVGMMAGNSFANACEGQMAFSDATSIPPRMIAWLRAWVDDGLVVGVAEARSIHPPELEPRNEGPRATGIGAPLP